MISSPYTELWASAMTHRNSPKFRVNEKRKANGGAVQKIVAAHFDDKTPLEIAEHVAQALRNHSPALCETQLPKGLFKGCLGSK